MPTPTAEKLRCYYPSKKQTQDGDPLDVFEVDSADELSIVDATLNQADDYWNGAIVMMLDGALAGEVNHVKDFVADDDELIFFKPWSAAPSAGDDFIMWLGGNYRSTQEINGLTISGISNVTGVTGDYAAFENGVGNGTLNFTASGTLATWTAPGDTAGAPVNIGGDGSYTLFSGDNNKYIQITVVASSLPGGDEADTIALAQPAGEIIPDFEGQETSPGATRYHAVVVKNEDGGGNDMLDARVYVSPDTPGTPSTMAEGVTIAEDFVEVTDASDWPTESFWIYNIDKDDLRFCVYRSGNFCKTADATGGHRGKTAQAWDSSDDVRVFPEIDIAIDAPDSDQFENPTDVNTAPSGMTFSAPEDYTDGLQIGTLADGEIYLIWIREVVPAGARARASVENRITVEWT